MEATQFQKIKGLLPVEVTTAFFAIQKIFNGQLDPETGLFPGASHDWEWMLIIIGVLCIANWIYNIRGGFNWGWNLFSTIGFLIWVVNIDIVRWQDPMSYYLGVSPEGFAVNKLLPASAVLYSMFAVALAWKSNNGSGGN